MISRLFSAQIANRSSAVRRWLASGVAAHGPESPEEQASMARAIDLSARKMGVAIAALGAVAYYFMKEYSNMQSIDSDGSEKSSPALSPKEFLPFKLSEIIEVNHNSNIYRFNLEKSNQSANVPVASCILVQAPSVQEPEKTIARPYTPISTSRDYGHFDLLIKVYPNGNVSSYMASLKPGQFVNIKGPLSKLAYEPNMKERIGMIAGGTGITPMLQVIEHALGEATDNTKFDLLYANVSPSDILLKDRLDNLAAKFPNRLKIHYIVNKGDSSWTGLTGYITKDIVEKCMPSTSNANASVYVCGPPKMMQMISGEKAKDKSQGELTGILKDIGYAPSQVFKF